MQSGLPHAAAVPKEGLASQQRAFVLLEAARLRCAALMSHTGRRTHLSAIHRELGMAGYLACEHFGPDERQRFLVTAASRPADDRLSAKGRLDVGLSIGLTSTALDEPDGTMDPPEMGHALARMFSEAIGASDALASELALDDLEDDERNRLQAVHTHVMAACELLDERLTVLELHDAGALTY